MPDGMTMTPENSYNQFKIGPDEGHQMRIGGEIKNLLGAEDNSNSEMEAMYANYSMDEERSRMDPEFQRMINAESPKDIAPMLDSLRRENDTDLMDAIDKYGNTRALSAAWKRSMVLEKGHDYLTSPDHLIVVKRNNRRLPGTINKDGSIGEDSVPRVGGYSLYVDVRKVEIPDIRTSPSKNGPVEYTVMVPTRKEEVNYGTEQMRKILSKTYLEFVKQGVVVDQVFNHANLLWNFRAALEGMVKTIYTKEIYKSNFSIQNFFSAPELSEMESNPENKKVGEQRDKATRLLELVGYCETKEKLEEHLNGTFNLESILNNETQNRVLGFMKESGVITESQFNTLKEQEIGSIKPDEVDNKYKTVVEFLLNKNIEITKDSRGVMQYKLKGWLTADQRDPSKGGKGKKAIGDEKGVRGWLTKFGNPYVGHVPYDRDNLTALLARMSVVVGNSQSTSEAFRNFYWWGESDWLGAEIYAKDALPDGATLAKKRSELRGQAWLDYAGEVGSYFTTGGEPNGTDLVKIMWPDLYRLKDFVAGQGRPTGQYVTVMQGMDHLAQSLFGLVRSEVNINGISKWRNLREQWLGSKDETLGIEKPHNLGDIEWTRVGGPTEVLTELLTNKIGGIDWKDIELTDSTKKMIESYQKGGDRAGLVKIVNDLVDSKTEAIGAGAEGFYWLMNFLVGDENEIKRMWAALNTELKPDTLTVTNGFTGKIKFMDITQVAQGSYDGYIAVEKRAIANKKYNKDNEPDIEGQKTDEAKARAKKYLRIWFKGVKGDPSYRTWAMKRIDRLKLGGNSTEQITYGEYVDSLAEMYDFMDKDDSRKPLNNFPKLQVDII